jgi:tetratricopeptide (TPR) repeat protein
VSQSDAAAADRGTLPLQPDFAGAGALQDRYLRIALATELCRRGKLDEAEARMRPLLAEADTDHEIQHVLGIMAWQRGDRLGTVEHLRRAIAIEDGIAAYHGDLGHACLGCGHYRDAADAFRNNLRLEPASAQAQFGLSKALLGLEDHAGAAQALEAAIASDPAGLAALAIGLTLVRLSRPAAALDYLRQALTLQADVGASRKMVEDILRASALLATGGTSIPTVDQAEVYQQLGTTLRTLGYFDDASRALNEALMLRPGMPAATAALDSLADIAKAPESFVPAAVSATALPELATDRLSQYLTLFADRRTLSKSRFYPGLAQRRWHDRHGFAITRALEDSHEAICREVDALDDPDFYHDSEGLVRDGQWRIFHFYERGKKHQANCARCPVITEIIERHDEAIRAPGGLIYISRMVPGTHIVPHIGPTNLRLRSHLGIHVPEGDCRLRVGGETRGWVQGECIVFDDTFEHEAWNFTNEARTVLIVDIWHPDLTAREVDVLQGLHGYALHESANLERYWNANARSRKSAEANYD